MCVKAKQRGDADDAFFFHGGANEDLAQRLKYGGREIMFLAEAED